MSQKVISCPR